VRLRGKGDDGHAGDGLAAMVDDPSRDRCRPGHDEIAPHRARPGNLDDHAVEHDARRRRVPAGHPSVSVSEDHGEPARETVDRVPSGGVGRGAHGAGERVGARDERTHGESRHGATVLLGDERSGDRRWTLRRGGRLRLFPGGVLRRG
jgi:hypothetical protein